MLVGLLIAVLATGVALGLVFRGFVLIPMSLAVAVLASVVSLHQGGEPLRVLIVTSATVTSLQLGYVLGYVLGWLLHMLLVRFRSLESSSERCCPQGQAGRRWAVDRW